MSDNWTDRLSEYIDGDLAPVERAELEAHLTVCDQCRALVDELRAVAGRAAKLEDAPPAADLWPAIRDRIGGDVRVIPLAPVAPPARVRRLTLSLPQLAAAAAVVAFLSGGAVWLALQTGGSPEPAFVVDEAGQIPAESTGIQFAAAREYDLTINQLERDLTEARDRLDPATVAVIERNLDVIDGAIAEARQALIGDPANPYLHRHLDNTLMKKIEVLRRVTTIGRGRT